MKIWIGKLHESWQQDIILREWEIGKNQYLFNYNPLCDFVLPFNPW